MGKPNILTKDGLTENSGLNVEGFGGIFHISAPYAAGDKKVFVETRDFGWRRMTVTRAKKENRTIIPCSYCKRPAITVDHYHPYHNEMTHCAWHRNAYSNSLKQAS